MANRFGRLTLRDFFWLMLLAAIAVGWYLERTRAVKQIAKYSLWPFGRVTTAGPSPAALQRQEWLVQYRALSNEQLDKLLSTAPANAFYASGEFHCCLSEMIRRKMHAELQVHYDKIMQAGDTQFGGPANALLLTALRRAQGKPDPVEVQANLGMPTTLVDGRPEPSPGILVNLKNRDSESICLTRGGDYRSGRQTRWRVQLTNEKGTRLADSNFPANMIGGGISQFVPLKPAELLYEENRLDARSYVHSPPPGRYQLQAIYAEQEIADEADLTGLIHWRSQPIDVVVDNQTPHFEQRFSVLPLLSILLCGAVLFAVAEMVRRRHRNAPNEPSRWWKNWRDYLALTLLLVATSGWLIDARWLARELERLRPDQEARWSLRLIDAH